MQSKFITVTIVLLAISCQQIKASKEGDTYAEIEAPDGDLYNPNPGECTCG